MSIYFGVQQKSKLNSGVSLDFSVQL